MGAACCKIPSVLNHQIETNEEIESYQKALRRTLTKRIPNERHINTDVNEAPVKYMENLLFMQNLSEILHLNNSNDIIEQMFGEINYQERIQKLLILNNMKVSQNLHINIYHNDIKMRKIITITPQGKTGGKLQRLDGFVFFGIDDPTEGIQNDFCLDFSECNVDLERIKGIRVFLVYYDLLTNRYFLRDLNSGIGTFMKIKNETVLKNNTLINIGDSFVLASYNDEEQQLINLKILNPNGQALQDPMYKYF